MSTRRGFGSIKARVLKSSRTTYIASFVNPQTSKRVSRSFPSKAMASSWLHDRRRQILTGEFTASKTPVVTKTVEQAGREWLETLDTTGRKGSTIYTYESKLKYLFEKLGGRHLSTLTHTDLERFIQDATAELTQGAAANNIQVSRALLRWSAKRGYLDRLILQRVDWPIFTPVKDPERRQVATPEEVAIMANAMPDRYRLAVFLAAWCALRMGEVCGLQRQDFTGLENEQTPLISIVRQVNSKMGGAYTDLKTKAGKRKITIPDALVPLITTHLKTYVGPDPQSPVFPSSQDQNTPVHHNTLRNAFTTARQQAGMPWFVFHDLRHTGLTYFAQQGATLAELLERGGHTDIEVALKYQHATLERDRTLTAKMNTNIKTH